MATNPVHSAQAVTAHTPPPAEPVGLFEPSLTVSGLFRRVVSAAPKEAAAAATHELSEKKTPSFSSR